MEDFIAFLIISAGFILAALVNAKKTKTKGLQKPLANPTPAAPHRETLEEYMERQRKAAEGRLKEAEEARRRAAEEAAARRKKIQDAEAARQRIAEEATAAGPIEGEGIAVTSTDSIEDLKPQTAQDMKPFAPDPEEMVIYSEILSPKFEEY